MVIQQEKNRCLKNITIALGQNKVTGSFKKQNKLSLSTVLQLNFMIAYYLTLVCGAFC